MSKMAKLRISLPRNLCVIFGMASPPSPPFALISAPPEPQVDRPRLSPSRSPVKAQTIVDNFASAREERRERVWTERHDNRADHALRNRKNKAHSGAVPAAAGQGRSSASRAAQATATSSITKARGTSETDSGEPINEKDNVRAHLATLVVNASP